MLDVREASGSEKPVLGISEWMCYYANYGKHCPGPQAIDECVELHLGAGCDLLVWNLGRSVVDYWSDLPSVTRMCENGDRARGRSAWNKVWNPRVRSLSLLQGGSSTPIGGGAVSLTRRIVVSLFRTLRLQLWWASPARC